MEANTHDPSERLALNPRPGEPTPLTMTNPLRRYWLAVRPPFLTVTLAGFGIGLTYTLYRGASLNGLTAALTLLGAVLIHAAVNVLNDYYDSLNRTDAINEERLFPFTGGSRFIQNGVFTELLTLRYGLGLLAGGVCIGLLLSMLTNWWLAGLGVVGIFIGWAYSAPPVQLNNRGWGEVCVAVGFGILIPMGTDFVQRQVYDWRLLIIGLPYALLVTNILYINQFPDRAADAAAGKHHWVVRLGTRRGRWVYATNVGLALLGLVAAVTTGLLSAWALISLIPLGLAVRAAAVLIDRANAPAQLLAAIKMTIASALGHGVLLALVLTFTTGG